MTRTLRAYAVAALAAGAMVFAGSAMARDLSPERLSGRAFESAQWVMATAAARSVAQVGARAAVGDGALAQVIRRRQSLENNLKALRARLGAGDETGEVRAGVLEITKELNAVDGHIRKRFPEYAELSNPQPLGYEEVRVLLHPGEALVLFLSSRTSTYVWAVSDEAFSWHRSDLGREDLARMVRTLRDDLDPTALARAAVGMFEDDAGTLAPFDHRAAHELYRELIEPVMPVLSPASHVFAVKDGPLTSIPLSVLVTRPQAGDAVSPDDWLIQEFALTTLPAVSSLGPIRARTPEGEARGDVRFVGFGAPDFSAGAKRGTSAMIASRSIDIFFDASGSKLEAIRALAPLPGTARELRRIADLFPDGQSAITLGAEATEAAIRSADLGTASIISFATHGLLTGEISGLAEPALVFTPPETATPGDDGLLTASEASELGLNADWVILSACNTAAGDGTPGAEGLSGLARAFLFAGARSILVSHWPVRDDVAATLTTETLKLLRDDPKLARSEALRRAMIGVLRDDSDPTLAHPSAWAPFVVVGEGGSLGR